MSTSPKYIDESIQTKPKPELYGVQQPKQFGEPGKAARTIWIDIDNSPHVPFFIPIIKELEKRGARLFLTARNMYQVCELLEYFQLSCKVVGSHFGKHKFLKVICNLLRASALIPLAMRRRPDLAVSHGSRAQVLVCKLLGIPSMVIHDYEYSTKTGFIDPDWILMPEIIPERAMSKNTDRILKYPGLKEDVYVPTFRPDPALLEQFHISNRDLVVTLRPPATEAHYHNVESEVLFRETLQYLSEHPHVRTFLLPRNTKQKEQLGVEWSSLIQSGRVTIPEKPTNGINLIWYSDLVISGGGTMNREAAALGVPVYSIFRGKIGAVDKYLAQQGRLVLIEKVEDVRSKIRLVRWARPQQPIQHNDTVLQSIVECVIAKAAGNRKPSQSALSSQI